MSYPRPARALAVRSSLIAVLGLAVLGAAPAFAATGTIDASVSVPTAVALPNVAAELVAANGNAATTGITVSGPSAVSGTAEKFTITGVPAGASYYVYFYDGTPADNLAPAFDGGATLATATPVTVPTAGGTVNAAVATMVAGGEITGTLTNATTGATLPGGTVTVLTTLDADADGDGFLKDGSGTFTATGDVYTITGLPSGTYVLRAGSTSTSPSFPDVYYVAGGLTQIAAQATELSISTSGAPQTADFAVPEAGTISGTVLDAATDSPLTGVVIEVYNSAGLPVEQTTSGGTGAYSEAGLLPGQYRLSFTQTNPALPLALQYYTAATTLAGATPVTVSAGGTMANINVALVPGGEISGTVTAAQGDAPLGGVGVFVMDAAGNVVANTVTAGNGSYAVGNLPAGTYYVEFAAPSFDDLQELTSSAPASFPYAPEFYGATLSLAGAAAVSVKANADAANINGVLLPSSATKIGLPTVSRESFDGLHENKAALAFTVAPGSGESADLSSIKVSLPAGFGWDRKLLSKDLSLSGVKFTYSVNKQALTVSFQPGQRGFRLSVKGGGVTVSKALRAKAKLHQIRSETIKLTVTNSQGIAAPLSFTVKKPS